MSNALFSSTGLIGVARHQAPLARARGPEGEKKEEEGKEKRKGEREKREGKGRRREGGMILITSPGLRVEAQVILTKMSG